VSFAGSENPYEHHAWTDAPLTSNYPAIRNALADRMLVDPEGGTDLAAGLLRGAIELLGTPSADSKPRAHSVRHLVVLTDGLPTLPEADPIGEARRAARKLAKHGIRVHIFAIGSAASDEGLDIAPVAEVTHGDYHAVEDLTKLAGRAQHFSVCLCIDDERDSQVASAAADPVTRAMVGARAVRRRREQIEVVAIAADGREQRVERRLVRRCRPRRRAKEAATGRWCCTPRPRRAKAHGKALTVEPAPAKASSDP
jgi:hypothetical protein